MKKFNHSKPKIIKGSKLKLGENPFWNYKQKELSFVDLKSKKFFIYKNQKLKTISLPFNISSLIPTRRKNHFVATTGNKVMKIIINYKRINITSLKNFVEPNNNRFNDAKCDNYGRLWISSMDKNEKLETGNLWCYENPKKIFKAEKNFSIGNGMDWSPDDKILYFVASDKRVIFSYKFNILNGNISRKKIFIKVPKKRGFPDGICTDREGCVWVAYWNGGCIARHYPSGKIQKIIYLPRKKITSLCFGGVKLDTIFVTSAEENLNKKIKKDGCVFKIKTNILGKKLNHFGNQSNQY